MPLIGYTRSIYFDGTMDYANVISSSMYPSGNFTLAAWVKPLNSGHRAVFSWGFSVSPWDAIVLALDGATMRNTLNQSFTATLNPSLNAWNHLACTYNGEALTTYRNGVVSNSVPASGTPRSPSYSLFLGLWNNSGSYDLHGYITDPRIYHRSLNAAEILNLYQGYEPLTSNLVGYWTLQEATGSFANAGSISNSPMTLANNAARNSDIPTVSQPQNGFYNPFHSPVFGAS